MGADVLATKSGGQHAYHPVVQCLCPEEGRYFFYCLMEQPDIYHDMTVLKPYIARIARPSPWEGLVIFNPCKECRIPLSVVFVINCKYNRESIPNTVDPRLTDFSSYRLLWPQNLDSTCSQRIDIQTRKKKPKWNKNRIKTASYGINQFSVHCRSMEIRLTDFSTCSHYSNTD